MPTMLLNSMAYGTEHGLVVVDIVQKVCLLNMASPDLYGAQDPYSRSPRSPKQNLGDQGRSPSIDQVSGFVVPIAVVVVVVVVRDGFPFGKAPRIGRHNDEPEPHANT